MTKRKLELCQLSTIVKTTEVNLAFPPFYVLRECEMGMSSYKIGHKQKDSRCDAFRLACPCSIQIIKHDLKVWANLSLMDQIYSDLRQHYASVDLPMQQSKPHFLCSFSRWNGWTACQRSHKCDHLQNNFLKCRKATEDQFSLQGAECKKVFS